MTVEKQPAVYIMASSRAGTLYTGVTSNLAGRAYQHRSGLIEGFSSRYGVTRLVWFEAHHDMASAIRREKQIKKWRRDWKLNLIEDANPDWRDLALTLGLVSSDVGANGSPPSRG